MNVLEKKLVNFAKRLHLQDGDVDYLLALLEESRGQGLVAGANLVSLAKAVAVEREACAKLVDEMAKRHDPWGNRGEIAAAIRARKG